MSDQKRLFEPDGPPRFESQTTPVGSVPTTRNEGVSPTLPLTREGFGIRNGIPYGMNAVRAERGLNRRFKFLPGWASRLGAAQRRAGGGQLAGVASLDDPEDD